jgi:hypothetical protein
MVADLVLLRECVAGWPFYRDVLQCTTMSSSVLGVNTEIRRVPPVTFSA